MDCVVEFLFNMCMCHIGTKYKKNDAQSQYNVRHLECSHFYLWMYTDDTPMSRIVVGSITGYKVYLYSETY